MWPILRLALLADIPELLSIESTSFAGDIISEDSWRGLIGSAAASVVVAEDPRGLVGDYVLLFNRKSSAARLYTIAVAPEWRGRGVARLMSQDAIVRSIGRGATYLRLETPAENRQAQRLFDNLGFRPFKRVPNLNRETVAAVRYELKLADV
jgi:ribosomal-protein-alanine N-acetyltransferase